MFHAHLDPHSATLTLHGDLGIEHAQEIQQHLLAALPKAGTLTLHLAADRVDSSFVQLLIALQREAAARDIGLKVYDAGGMVAAWCQRLGAGSLWKNLGVEVAG